MSSSHQNGQAASVAITSQLNQQSPDFMNDIAKLETLIPKNLSSNKRAVIERLIALYQKNSIDR